MKIIPICTSKDSLISSMLSCIARILFTTVSQPTGSRANTSENLFSHNTRSLGWRTLTGRTPPSLTLSGFSPLPRRYRRKAPATIAHSRSLIVSRAPPDNPTIREASAVMAFTSATLSCCIDAVRLFPESGPCSCALLFANSRPTIRTKTRQRGLPHITATVAARPTPIPRVYPNAAPAATAAEVLKTFPQFMDDAWTAFLGFGVGAVAPAAFCASVKKMFLVTCVIACPSEVQWCTRKTRRQPPQGTLVSTQTLHRYLGSPGLKKGSLNLSSTNSFTPASVQFSSLTSCANPSFTGSKSGMSFQW
eukprot:RCo002745